MAVPAANSGLGGIARSELLSVKDVRSRLATMISVNAAAAAAYSTTCSKHSSIEQRKLLMACKIPRITGELEALYSGLDSVAKTQVRGGLSRASERIIGSKRTEAEKHELFERLLRSSDVHSIARFVSTNGLRKPRSGNRTITTTSTTTSTSTSSATTSRAASGYDNDKATDAMIDDREGARAAAVEPSRQGLACTPVRQTAA